MNPLRLLSILALPCLLGSCGLANSLLQAPVRLLQSAGRTISTNDEASSTPAQTNTAPTAEIALRLPSSH